MAQRYASWRNAVWALVYSLIAKPLARLGTLVYEVGIRVFIAADWFEDWTHTIKKKVEKKAWPD